MNEINSTDRLVDDLQRDGYCRIRGAYGESEVSAALDLVRTWQQRMEGRQAASVPYLNRGHPMLYNLQNKDILFLKLLFANETGQAVLRRCLNDEWYKQIPQDKANYILRSYLARSSTSALPMHIDSFVPFLGDYPVIMQYAIVLEPMNEETGGTVIVPGSHKAGRYVTQADRAQAVPVEADPGDLLIWDSRIWHGTSENRTDHSRWVLIATFCRWWIKQAFQIPEALPDEIFEQLTDEQKSIMGFCSIPYRDETHGIDMKRGFDDLTLSRSRLAG